MGDTGLAWGLIGGANPVPHHVHRNGRAPILDHDNVHAVVQGEGGNPILGRAQGQNGVGGRQAESSQQAAQGHGVSSLVPVAGV